MATEELVRGRLPEGVSLLDLGQHHFRDLIYPEHIFQAVIPGLPEQFPPLSSLIRFDLKEGDRLPRIRLVIVDDHTLFREGMKALLSTTDDIEVVGEAGDGSSALVQIQALKPDIVLMDINMPELNGIQATQKVLASHPGMGIIMLTMLEDDSSVFAAMRAGARGYLLKGANPGEMLHVIRAVAEGQALFGPAIASRLMRYFQDLSAVPASQFAGTPFAELTEREIEVLRLISQGYNNQEIAQKLVISPKTVRNHITNIFSKLQVADRAQAIVRARQAGLQ
jgi:DNA-binding NarL/FixJ family response regulator